MNKDFFIKYIENTRDCDIAILDIAVKKGLFKAKNDKLDFRKLYKLAAACIFMLAICLAVNMEPFKSASDNYYLNRNIMMPGSAEVLNGYIKNIADFFTIHFGGR